MQRAWQQIKFVPISSHVRAVVRLSFWKYSVTSVTNSGKLMQLVPSALYSSWVVQRNPSIWTIFIRNALTCTMRGRRHHSKKVENGHAHQARRKQNTRRPSWTCDLSNIVTSQLPLPPAHTVHLVTRDICRKGWPSLTEVTCTVMYTGITREQMCTSRLHCWTTALVSQFSHNMQHTMLRTRTVTCHIFMVMAPSLKQALGLGVPH